MPLVKLSKFVLQTCSVALRSRSVPSCTICGIEVMRKSGARGMWRNGLAALLAPHLNANPEGLKSWLTSGRPCYTYISDHHLVNRVTSCLIEARQGLHRMTSLEIFLFLDYHISEETSKSGLLFHFKPYIAKYIASMSS